MIDSTLLNANILIVDDQMANIEVLEGLLEMQGFASIKTTTDPREVVSLLESFRPDLILLDLMMPHLNGFEVMEQIKPLLPPDSILPILILTADVTPESKKKALSNGASDFLTKPFDLVEVGLRIRNLLFSSYLQQQLLNQNQILEEKVRERTFELEQSNIQLKLAKEKAESSDRLKSAFLNNISHEIRTPLNGIVGFGAILLNQEISLEERTEYLSIMESSSNRLIRTVTDYLDISMLVSGNMEKKELPFSPARLVRELYNEYTPAVQEKKLSFDCQISHPDDQFFLTSDPDLLRKAVAHLIENAIKFTNQGGIFLRLEKQEGQLVFSITDTGIGIGTAAQVSVFDYFMQENVSSTRNHEGSGLGLSIAHHIMEFLGGSVDLRSQKGEGSTFRLILPERQG